MSEIQSPPPSKRFFFGVLMVGMVIVAVTVVALAAEWVARSQRAGEIEGRISVVENLVRTNAAYNKALFPGYKGREEEAARFFQEQADGGSIYRPFVEYRRIPGLSRSGWNTNSLSYRGPEFEIRKPPGVYRILLFGGSFVWGTGALSDEETISGHLQRILNETAPGGVRFEVVNCGESNYQTTQEAILLLIEGVYLSPDLVLFLDGVNDTQKGADGLPAGYPVAFDVFNRMFTGSGKQKAGFTIDNELEYLKKQREVIWSATGSALMDRVSSLWESTGIRSGEELSADITPPEEMALRHLTNLRAVRGLGSEFQFKTGFAVQPIPILHKPLHSGEQEALAALRETDTYYGVFAWWERFYDRYAEQVLAGAEQEGMPILDLRRVFENHPEPLYIDFCHVTGEGYRIIAESFAGWLREEDLIPEGDQSGTGGPPPAGMSSLTESGR